MYLVIIATLFGIISGKAIDLLEVGSLDPISPNYCNDSAVMEEAGLIKATLGQFLGYECSAEFYHCRWQSDGFRTYRKHCKTGLVYDVLGTQNCNYDYNVRSCGIRGEGPVTCNSTSFHCSLSEQCVPLSQRCDGHYECALEEDEQNCPLCAADEFACIVSEQCIEANRRCNGIAECSDGTDEMDCDVCGNGLFHCSKSGECIPNEERCDGKRHCPHGEDEMLCKKNPADRYFTCQSLLEKIPMVQCRDGSDEIYCEMGVGAGHAAAESSISFSSNPNPVAPNDRSDYSVDYEQEAPANEENPSFPMLAMSLPPPPPKRANIPSTSRSPPRIAPSKIPSASSGTFSKRIKPTTEATTQADFKLITTTARTTSKQTPRPTSPSPKSSSKPTASAPSKPNRYLTKPASQVQERVLSVVETKVRPRNEASKQLFAQPSSSEKGSFSGGVATTLPSVVHEVKVTSEPADPLSADTADPRAKILKRLGAQLNGRMSPHLLSKIEELLTNELAATVKKGNSTGVATESSPLMRLP